LEKNESILAPGEPARGNKNPYSLLARPPAGSGGEYGFFVAGQPARSEYGFFRGAGPRGSEYGFLRGRGRVWI